MAGTKKQNNLRVNRAIRAPEVLVIGPDGKQIGVKPILEALEIAKKENLDLVEVSPFAKPPVCRLLDYGKYRFEETQKLRGKRSKSPANAIKEMKYRPKIGHGDFETKTKQVIKFLEQGHKVRVTVMFRGREIMHPEFGQKVLDKLLEETSSLAKVEMPPKFENKNIVAVLSPLKASVKKPSMNSSSDSSHSNGQKA